MQRFVARRLAVPARQQAVLFINVDSLVNSGGGGGDSKYCDYFSKFLDTSSLQSAFGTGAAVPIILITTVLHDNIAKTSQDRPHQN